MPELRAWLWRVLAMACCVYDSDQKHDPYLTLFVSVTTRSCCCHACSHLNFWPPSRVTPCWGKQSLLSLFGTDPTSHCTPDARVLLLVCGSSPPTRSGSRCRAFLFLCLFPSERSGLLNRSVGFAYGGCIHTTKKNGSLISGDTYAITDHPYL